MKILDSVTEIRRVLKDKNEELGFVATMGALHIGHEELIKKSKIDNEYTVVSIFVNPKQFNNSQDLETYPNTMASDISKLEKLGVDFVFIPKADEIYIENDNISVTDTVDSLIIEGEKRPGHFDGVLTVVLKLFNILNPKRAYFGEKDYQQLSLIKSMVKSLFLNIDIIGVPIVRDEKGLPFSSRNLKLSAEGLKTAQEIASVFKSSHGKASFIKGFKDLNVTNIEIGLDYVEEKWGRLLTVYKVDGVRILDNKEKLN